MSRAWFNQQPWPPADLPWICFSGPQPGSPNLRPAFDLAQYGVRWFDIGNNGAGYPNITSGYPALPSRDQIREDFNDPEEIGADGVLFDWEPDLFGDNIWSGNPNRVIVQQVVDWLSATYQRIAETFPTLPVSGYHGGFANSGGVTWPADRNRMRYWAPFMGTAHMTGISLYNPCNAGNVVSEEPTINTWSMQAVNSVVAAKQFAGHRPLVGAFWTDVLFEDSSADIPLAQRRSQIQAKVSGGAQFIHIWDERAQRKSLAYNAPSVIARQIENINLIRVAYGRPAI